MPRGRPPKPTALRVLEGNPRKRRINVAPTPPPAPPLEPPAYVTGAAAIEWGRACAAMPAGFYTPADVPLLTVYCLAWVSYRNALALVAQGGMIGKGSRGQDCQNPALAIVQNQAELIIRTSDRLGMSPVARARLDVSAGAPERPPASPRGDLWGRGGVPTLAKG